MAKENRINTYAYTATTTVSILHMTTKPVIVPMTTSLVAVIFLALSKLVLVVTRTALPPMYRKCYFSSLHPR